MPKWIAPNVLTFAGFMLVVLNFLMLSYYDYDYYAASFSANNATLIDATTNGYEEVIPKSLWFIIAVFLFLAYTLGKILFLIYLITLCSLKQFFIVVEQQMV